MENLITSIQALSGTDADLAHLNQTLNQAEEDISARLARLNDALSVLDPTLHSLGWLHILYAKARVTISLDDVYWRDFLLQVQQFLKACSKAQILLAPQKFAFVCRKFVEVAIAQQQSKRTIRALQSALLKFQPSPEHLTPLHADFMQVCLVSKCYHAALPILQQEILEVNPAASALVPRDLLLYFYYAGMVYVGLKKYREAIDSFQLCITAPATALSAIVLEAYKKYVLVCLIVHGQVVPLPKYASSLQRHMKAAAQPYSDFATAYVEKDLKQVNLCFTANYAIFEKDTNVGLVKQCIACIAKKKIQRLTLIYLTLSLADIAENAKLSSAQEAETHVLRMIEAGEIRASIDQMNGMVCFHEDSAVQDGSDMVQKLDSHIAQVTSLTARLQRLHESISSDPAYLQKISVQDRQSRYDAEEMGFDVLNEKAAFSSKAMSFDM